MMPVVSEASFDQDFQISFITANNPVVATGTETFTGDDRGGIALSPQKLFYTGDSSTASFDIATLLNGTTLGFRDDGLVSDLSTQKLYSFGTVGGVIDFNSVCCGTSATLTRLIELDPVTGIPDGTEITLGNTITVFPNNSHDYGIFAGWGFVALYDPFDARVYIIDIPSGAVQFSTGVPTPDHSTCENWAFWGVAETTGTANHTTHVSLDTLASNQLVRTGPLPSGANEVISTIFSGLSDACSFTVAPQTNRWFVHYEGGGAFGCCEVIASADARFNLPLDFGDAPSPYPTTLIDDGARHFITGDGPFLGNKSPDPEANGQPTVNANGDDTDTDGDDEDGVTSILLEIGETQHNVDVVVGGASGFLDGWIDFNGDGVWDDFGAEKIFSSVFVTTGHNGLSFAVPAGAVIPNGKTYARFRISSAGGLAPTGVANDGEVEDYLVGQLPPGGNGGNGGNPGGNGGTGTGGTGGLPGNGGAPELPPAVGGALPLATLGGLFATLLWRRRRRA